MAKKTEHVDLGKKGSFKVHKGALHRALGVPEGKKIPASKMAGHHHGRLGHMIASAKGFAAMRHGKKKSSHKEAHHEKGTSTLGSLGRKR